MNNIDIFRLYGECKTELARIGVPVIEGRLDIPVELKLDGRMKAWGKCIRYWGEISGETKKYVIKINPKRAKFGYSSLKDTMIHELIHTVPGGVAKKR